MIALNYCGALQSVIFSSANEKRLQCNNSRKGKVNVFLGLRESQFKYVRMYVFDKAEQSLRAFDKAFDKISCERIT